jgi:ATP-binding cassette subfamily B protein
MFLLAVVLLFAQANLDLALPDLMSRIVNNGIQQSGIEEALPDAIRQDQLEKALLFMSPQAQEQVQDAYRLVEPGDPQADQIAETYPAVLTEPIYVLQTEDPTLIQEIEGPLAQSMLVITGIQRAIENPEAAQQMGQGIDLGFDPSQIPEGTDPFTVLAQMPDAQRQALAGMIENRFQSLGEGMVRQMAIAAVRSEYEALGVDLASLQTSYIMRTGAIMLTYTLLSALATISVGYLSARIAAGVGRDLRSDVFRKVESFSGAEFDKFSSASLITRSTNDITQLQMVTVIMVRMVFYAPIMGVGGVIRAIGKGSSMWWTIAVAVIVLLGMISILISIALPRFRRIQKLVDRLNLVARESLSGMMVIRAFNQQPFEKQRFEDANQDLTSNMLFISRAMAVMMPVMMLILNVMSVVIIWVGAHQVAEANMQVGDVMAFLQYAMQIVFSFLMLSMLFIILPRASVSADRIADVLETDLIIEDPPHPITWTGPFRGKVEFRNVSFRYPGADEDVLHNVSFVALPGQTTAFIGSTGSGKSTVVNLIPRFYDATQGQVLVDGLDVRQISQYDLREKIGYVPQKGILFSGTIESNLRLADEHADKELMYEAIEMAQASDFVAKNGNGNGLEMEISQKGANVSGGQKQRLSIARALVKQAPIYIFDDTFSALDFKTDVALRRALKQNTADSTILIVTQRVSTIKDAEQIVVLDEGKIVGIGTHEELMRDCETYQEIALSQLSLEELL